MANSWFSSDCMSGSVEAVKIGSYCIIVLKILKLYKNSIKWYSLAIYLQKNITKRFFFGWENFKQTIIPSCNFLLKNVHIFKRCFKTKMINWSNFLLRKSSYSANAGLRIHPNIVLLFFLTGLQFSKWDCSKQTQFWLTIKIGIKEK